jgi:tRNA U34 2-thiouridine synthase MnmA/TrmU
VNVGLHALIGVTFQQVISQRSLNWISHISLKLQAHNNTGQAVAIYDGDKLLGGGIIETKSEK